MTTATDPFAWPEDHRIRDLRTERDQALAAATLPGYTIDSDGTGDIWLWRTYDSRPDYPEAVLPKRAFRGHPDVWALIERAVAG